MKLEPKVKKFQEGGAAPAPAAEPMPAEQGAAPEQGGGGDEQLMQLAQKHHYFLNSVKSGSPIKK